MLGVFRHRDVEKSLNNLIEIFTKYRRVASAEPIIQMYWIATALVESIRDRGLEQDMPVNPLLGQVDRQLAPRLHAGQPSGHLERAHQSPMELRLPHQYQRPDELLAS